MFVFNILFSASFLRHFYDMLCAIVRHCVTAHCGKPAPLLAPHGGHNISKLEDKIYYRISKENQEEGDCRNALCVLLL